MGSIDNSTFYLPDIDISPWVKDRTSPAAERVIDEVRRACTSTGFFQMTGHSLSPSVARDIFTAAAKFFALPEKVKQDLDIFKTVGFRGYELLGTQSYESNVKPDLREGFITGIDHKPDDPRIQNKRFFAGHNVWPSPDVLPYSEFRYPVESYFEKLMQLCWTVMDIIAATLPYGPDVFDEWKSHEPICPLRLLHYPPTPEDVEGEKRQLGASAHTDFGAVTLLLQDEHEGLEVLNKDTGAFVLVPPKPGAYVINIGEMMTRITGGLYKSSTHRVINKGSDDRYSVVFFFDGHVDYKLRRLENIGQPIGEEEDIMTVEEHLRWMVERRKATSAK